MIDAIIDDYITEDDYLKFEDKYEIERKIGKVSVNTQFEYGWCLIRTQYKEDIQKGVQLLEGLCSSKTDQRDFLFFISIGHYKLGDYTKALKYVKRLLVIEPSNQQAKDLESAIERKMKSDGLVGFAIMGGVAALFGFVVGAALVRK